MCDIYLKQWMITNRKSSILHDMAERQNDDLLVMTIQKIIQVTILIIQYKHSNYIAITIVKISWCWILDLTLRWEDLPALAQRGA